MPNHQYIAVQHKDGDGSMAKVKSKTASTAKKAVPAKNKAKQSAKTVAKKNITPKAEKPKDEKLVTNIVEVKSNKTSKTGVSKMTKSTEKKATEETVESAKSFFSDVRERATTAADKGRELLSEATTVTRANLEAVTESGKIAAKGTQELAKENLAYVKSNLTDAQNAAKELAAVKSPTEFVKVQSDLARKGFDTMVTQGSKNTETMIKLAGDIFQPLSNRLSVASDFFKKAA